MRRAHPPPFGNPQVAARHGLDRTYILEVPAGTDAAAMADDFAALEGEVEFAEVDAIGSVAGQFIPDDPEFWKQWNLHNTGRFTATEDADIDAPEAWSLHTGDLGTVTVAILDTGVTPHPEFNYCEGGSNPGDPCMSEVDCQACDSGDRAGEVCCPGGGICDAATCSGGDRTGEACCPNGACGTAGTCRTRMVRGINTDNPTTPDLTTDGCPHGTHVAGIVAAQGNNGEGVAGVTWGANIMPVRVMGATVGPCSGEENAAANGIIWAADNGADIINISLQYYFGGLNFKDAVDYAHELGVLVVSAAGNNDGGGVGVLAAPARFTNSMAISGTTDQDEFATFTTTRSPSWSSNFGGNICNGGTLAGRSCENDTDCPDGVCVEVAHCEGGSNHASLCASDLDCRACLGGTRTSEICCPGDGVCTVGMCIGGERDGEDCCPNSICGARGPCVPDMIDVSAPGDRVYSTEPTGYGPRSGTSMSAPHVSGTAALMKSFVPTLTNDQIWSAITGTADDLGPAGWDILFGYGRLNAFQAIVGIGPIRFLRTWPPRFSIDARQPSEPNGSDRTGWQLVDLLIGGDLSGMTVDAFELVQEGANEPLPLLLALQERIDSHFNIRVILSRGISVEAWTTITHVDSGSSVRIGYLPGDTNGNGVSDGTDVTTLTDAIKGPPDALQVWSVDIDRSGKLAPADILREIDLLNGAEEYDTYEGARLPPS
jgi:subtilisin family serine protease